MFIYDQASFLRLKRKCLCYDSNALKINYHSRFIHESVVGILLFDKLTREKRGILLVNNTSNINSLDILLLKSGVELF